VGMPCKANDVASDYPEKGCYMYQPRSQGLSPFTAQRERSWVVSSIERFSIECRKTKTKVIHKGRRQYSEPIKTRGNYM